MLLELLHLLRIGSFSMSWPHTTADLRLELLVEAHSALYHIQRMANLAEETPLDKSEAAAITAFLDLAKGLCDALAT